MKQGNWVSVKEYADFIGQTVQWIYISIRTGKIPKDKVRKIKAKEILQIFLDK